MRQVDVIAIIVVTIIIVIILFLAISRSRNRRNIRPHFSSDSSSLDSNTSDSSSSDSHQGRYKTTSGNKGHEKTCNCVKACKCKKKGHYRAPKPDPSEPSTSGYIITGTTTIVGNHTPIDPPSQCPDSTCESSRAICPTPTPGTPSGGLFILQNSFVGKLTFCGVLGMELDLKGRTLSNNSGITLELINCSQVWIHGGAINNANGIAISVTCSSNVCISRISTRDTLNAVSITNSYDVIVKNIYMDNILGYSLSLSCSNYLRFTNWDVSNITSYGDDLIIGESSQMIFMSNMVFYNINVTDVYGIKTVTRFNNCFDVKVSHISILTTSYVARNNRDLSVYLFYFSQCGSLVLGSFIINGDSTEVSGVSAGEFSCLRLENVNNVFSAHNMMTDNMLIGDESSTSLTLDGIHLTEVDILGLNSSKICTNKISSINGSPISSNACISVRGVYAANGSTCETFNNTSNGGNWIISGSVCNENNIEGFSSPDSSVYGFEIIDAEKSLTVQRCTANNNGNGGNNSGLANEAGGFKIRGVTPANNAEINVVIDTCAANQNSSVNLTAGFLCTYSNTQIFSSEAISNISQREKCCGFLLPGLVNIQQLTVSLFKCTGNTNFSFNGAAYGAYIGKVDIGDGLTQGVQTLLIKDCTFSANGPSVGTNPPNPGYGIYMSQVMVSSIIHNTLNQNNWGLYVDRGSYQSLDTNSALYNDFGFEVDNSPFSIFQDNLSQGNEDGYVDNSSNQTYISNKAVGNTNTSFERVSGSIIPWYAYDTAAGVYILRSGPPGITTFTNLST